MRGRQWLFHGRTSWRSPLHALYGQAALHSAAAACPRSVTCRLECSPSVGWPEKEVSMTVAEWDLGQNMDTTKSEGFMKAVTSTHICWARREVAAWNYKNKTKVVHVLVMSLNKKTCLVSIVDGNLCGKLVFWEGCGMTMQDSHVPIGWGATRWGSSHIHLQPAISSRQRVQLFHPLASNTHPHLNKDKWLQTNSELVIHKTKWNFSVKKQITHLYRLCPSGQYSCHQATAVTMGQQNHVVQQVGQPEQGTTSREHMVFMVFYHMVYQCCQIIIFVWVVTVKECHLKSQTR